MTSAEGNGVTEAKNMNSVHEDMSKPLSHYFVSSTHNSYLEGNQLTSDASADAVAAVLQAGARVVELDCHDGKDGQPLVKHGGTMTKPVSFRDCCIAVSKYAFEASEFPVILTLEIHCSHEQQKVQAAILREELGSKLYIPSSRVNVGAHASEFLSPGLLKKKVLIRYKPKKFDQAAKKLKKAETGLAKKANEVDRLRELVREDEDTHKYEDADQKRRQLKRSQSVMKLKKAEDALLAQQHTLSHQQHVVKHEIQKKKKEHATEGLVDDVLDDHPLSHKMEDGTHGHGEEEVDHHDDDIYTSSESEDDEETKRNEDEKDQVYDCVPELLELVYIQNRKFKDSLFELEWHENQAAAAASKSYKASTTSHPHRHMLGASSHSLSEKKLQKVSSGKAKFGHAPGGRVLRNKDCLRDYSRRHLIRIFPAASRIFSSNYDPQEAWEYGCQVVALNYQTKNRAVWIDRGKFSANGGCGYVLKPEWMLSTPGSKDLPSGAKLVLTIIGGHKLPKPSGRRLDGDVIDPYVCLEISGSLAASSPATKVNDDHQQLSKVATKVVNDNDFNPYWGEKFVFHLLRPELATVLLVVRDHKVMGHDMMQPDFVAQYAFPVAGMRQGYRTAPLKDKGGRVHPGSVLFLRLEMTPL
jgi:phosphatidylinositol phospholipase C eta